MLARHAAPEFCAFACAVPRRRRPWLHWAEPVTKTPHAPDALRGARHHNAGDAVLDAFDKQTREWFEREPALDRSPPRLRLRCAACGHLLAGTARRHPVEGRERHVRTNPGGYTYAMRTYDDAPGCRVNGSPSSVHSWFPPLDWRLAVCGGCGAHCGWSFGTDAAPAFIALIENRFIEELRA